nr:integrase, catalytic region, zinc finger, CCHC-type, peptidase aspartic, catalytic [Tanacetum cinerariifolium]
MIEVMNLILISIPNEIYNSVDACTTAKAIWERVKRLMRGTMQNTVDRETRFNNEFDQFVAKLGEALVSIYSCFAQLMNDMERNGITFSLVTVNIKFLNCLQFEWCNELFKLRLQDVLQMFNATIAVRKDEAGVTLTDEQNDFLVTEATRMEEIKELIADICLMARIQPTNIDSDAGPSFDYAFLRERGSIEIQEGMQKRINILESDVQRCQKQSLDFELQLQHEKERGKCESSLKSVCETSWISKMEKLESEKVSLEFQVQSLTKERENVKSKYQTLFDSIKKTRTQTQGEINELIEHVNQKTYAYVEVRAQNQDILITISELKAKLKNVKKRLCQEDNCHNRGENLSFNLWLLGAFLQPNERTTYVETKNVVSNKKIVIDVDVKNDLKAKDVLCVSCAKNVLISCHDKCLVNYKLNVHSKVRRALFTTPRTAKSRFEDTTHVVSKTRFSVTTTQSKSLDATPTYVETKNVVSNKKIVIDVDVKNDLKAKDVLCVSCAKNVLISCHDKCLVNYKLNVHSKVRRALFTTPRTAKSRFEDTTHVVSKTRFSVTTTQSKSLDATPVVSKTKIAIITLLRAKNKISSTFKSISVVQIVLWIVDSSCSKHMTGPGHNLFNVGQICDSDLKVAFRSSTCYVQNLEGDVLLRGARESNLYTISISDMAASSPVCLLSKATSTKSWLWHRRLSHLNS